MNRRQADRCILLIEDNLGDVVLFRESLAEADSSTELLVFRSYEEVEESLPAIEVAYKSKGMIAVVDLNLLRCSGIDIITLLRSKTNLQHLPIVIFTSSLAPTDIMRSYQAGVNAYVPKPDDLAGYRSVAKSLVDFWLYQAVTTSSVNLVS
ncbi:MAG: response regulator [Pirellula sp.]|jgi:CheY-like chemotaxis protein|nr:response regulator [Pirellula sp.]